MAVMNHILFAHIQLVPVIATLVKLTYLAPGTPWWRKRFPQSEASLLHCGLADHFQYYTLLPGTHMFVRTSFPSFCFKPRFPVQRRVQITLLWVGDWYVRRAHHSSFCYHLYLYRCGRMCKHSMWSTRGLWKHTRILYLYLSSGLHGSGEYLSG